MLTALRQPDPQDDDKVIAAEGVSGYCIFCKKPVTARLFGKFYQFVCGCKEERAYYRRA